MLKYMLDTNIVIYTMNKWQYGWHENKNGN